MPNNLSLLAKNIKKYRNKLGISQDRLSKLADITLHTLTKIGYGELRGGKDALQYKDYILVLLFVRYVSDKYAG